MKKLRHPSLDRTISVPDGSAAALRRSGWEEVETEVEIPPSFQREDPPEDETEPNDEEGGEES
jgi:hypothetical protein